MRRIFRYLGILLIIELIISLMIAIPAHATIIISPLDATSTTPGSTISLSGTSTTSGDSITIELDSTVYLNTATAASSGTSPYSWSTSFIIPLLTAGGSHTIVATGTGGTRSVSLTIAPKISLSRSTGTVGNPVTATGYGFSANDPDIRITFDSNQSNVSTTSDSNGYINPTFNLPTLTAGLRTVTTTDSNGLYATATFTYYATPTISLSKSNGPTGSSVTVTGSGFASSESGVKVSINNTQVGNTTTAGSTGGWTVTFNVPTLPSGSYDVGAQGSTTAYTSVQTQSFSVTPSINLNSTTAPTGATVSVSGTGFAAHEDNIVITWDGTDLGSPTQADDNGSWTNSFVVPATASGSHVIKAKGSSTQATGVPSLTFKVASAISLGKPSGTVGSVITMTGSGFNANEPNIVITFDGKPTGSPSIANAQGNWTGTFTVPPVHGGSYTIGVNRSASGASPVTGSTFTVLASTAINKTSGVTGNSITISGSGFNAGENNITISYDNAPLGKTDADANGAFSVTLSIPVSPSGNHVIKIYGSSTTSISTGDLSYKVAQSISINPTSGNVGQTVTLSGAGFTAKSPITITYDGKDIKDVNGNSVTTDENGSFREMITVPKSKAGAHTITINDAQNTESTITFNINNTPPPIPTPTSPRDGVRSGFIGDTEPTFKWEAVTDPSGVIYSLQIDENSDFSDPILTKTDLNANKYTLSQSESLSQGTYYWRVKAINGASVESGWSQPLLLKIDLMSTMTFILLLLLVVVVIGVVVYFLLVRPRRKAASTMAPVPEIVIPEVVNAEYRSLDSEEPNKKRNLPWRLALPQAPVAPKGAKNLSTEDQARLKVIIDFARSLPLAEPGASTHWLVDMAESATGSQASPNLYDQLIKGDIQLHYEPAWMKHPTFLDLQILLEGQPILLDLNSFVDAVNHTAAESVLLLQEVYRDVTGETGSDILDNGGWSYISGIYSDSLSWFLGKYLREPSEREYSFKPAGQNSEGASVYGLYGEPNTPFPGLLVQTPGEENTARLRALHIKLRRVYRNNDRSRNIVSMITQLDVQRTKLLNAFAQFNRLST